MPTVHAILKMLTKDISFPEHSLTKIKVAKETEIDIVKP